MSFVIWWHIQVDVQVGPRWVSCGWVVRLLLPSGHKSRYHWTRHWNAVVEASSMCSCRITISPMGINAVYWYSYIKLTVTVVFKLSVTLPEPSEKLNLSISLISSQTSLCTYTKSCLNDPVYVWSMCMLYYVFRIYFALVLLVLTLPMCSLQGRS